MHFHADRLGASGFDSLVDIGPLDVAGFGEVDLREDDGRFSSRLPSEGQAPLHKPWPPSTS